MGKKRSREAQIQDKNQKALEWYFILVQKLRHPHISKATSYWGVGRASLPLGLQIQVPDL